MTIIICKVQSGMCNRLIPFITSYRLAMNLNLKYYLNWNNECSDITYRYKGVKTTYNDMFQNIDHVNYINDNQLQTLLNNKKIITINYCKTDMEKYTTDNLLQYDIIFFNNYVHPIFTKEDNVIIPNYSSIDWVVSDNNYLKDIQKYFKLLKPATDIQNKINEVLTLFPEDNNIIAIHIRHWHRQFFTDKMHLDLMSGNQEKRIQFIKDELNKNSNTKFFISSTDKTAIDDIIERFGENKIIYFKNRFGETFDDKYYISNSNNSSSNIYKNKNGVVDLFLLSKCKNIIGDVGSSYSLCAPLLNNNTSYIPIKVVDYKL